MSANECDQCLQAFKGKKKGVTANSVNADAKWNTVAGDLFSALPSEGFGKEAGDFAIGQLVQVGDRTQIASPKALLTPRLRSSRAGRALRWQPSQYASAHHGARSSPQVARSDGSWTYGKIMDYDPSGDVYSVMTKRGLKRGPGLLLMTPLIASLIASLIISQVMTKRGPKYFVEKSDITEDVCINPGNGGCAQQ
jgi:hypothetical protein